MWEPNIVVVGSSNTDMVIKSLRIPAVGETVTGGSFYTAPGGKGANQAVALARLGANVVFVSCVGQDEYGRQSLEQYKKEGIDTTYVTSLEDSSSGIALVLVGRSGENLISVASGANAKLTPAHIDQAASAIKSADMLVMQLEVPLETVEYAAKIAAEAGVPVFLNPAPAPTVPLPESLLKNVYCITPNEREAFQLTGVKVHIYAENSEVEAAKILLDRGVKKVVITRGSWKTYCVDPPEPGFEIDPLPVIAVDTTGAGDVFSAAVAHALAWNYPLCVAATYATVVAAISVTYEGAQPSFVRAADLKKETDALRTKFPIPLSPKNS
ncbi:MAG: ribokinase [Thermoguttaceae bacterium]|nr:ribokinase [Thermoguttaceae bacterium]